MKMGKIGKIMMVVFMFGLLAGPVCSLALVPDVSAAVTSKGLNTPSAASVGYAGTETDLVKIVETIVKWVVGFVVLMSIFMFAYGGLTYITAGGDETKVENAKKALTSALFGLMIAALSYAIVTLIINFVKT